MSEHHWSLRELYRTLDDLGKNPLRDAQEKLNRAVRSAYKAKQGADMLSFLMELNKELVAREAKGGPIMAPGVPLGFKDLSSLLSTDCIRMPTSLSE